MRLLQLRSVKELFSVNLVLKDYDVVIVRENLSLGSMYEGKNLHVSVTSESSALGVLKSIDRYLREKYKLAPFTFEIPRIGEIKFVYDEYNDIYRVYGEVYLNGSTPKSMYYADYALKIENCAVGRVLLGKSESKNILIVEIIKKIITSSELTQHNVRNLKEILVKGPVVGITGEESLINDLVGYLEKVPFEKVRSYYEYPLTEEEKSELERLKDKENFEDWESYLKIFLIANELGWLDDNKTQKIRKDIFKQMKKVKCFNCCY